MRLRELKSTMLQPTAHFRERRGPALRSAPSKARRRDVRFYLRREPISTVIIVFPPTSGGSGLLGFNNVQRQAVDVRGLRDGVCVHRGRAGAVRPAWVHERTEAMRPLPGREKGLRRRRRRWRRDGRRAQGDVRRRLRLLRKSRSGPLQAPRRPARLLQRLFRTATEIGGEHPWRKR